MHIEYKNNSSVINYDDSEEDWGEEYNKLADLYAKKCKEVRELKDKINQIRVDVIDECADLFSNILPDMTNVCGINCPVKCNWGTEESCKDMCKKWFLEQLKENK